MKCSANKSSSFSPKNLESFRPLSHSHTYQVPANMPSKKRALSPSPASPARKLDKKYKSSFQSGWAKEFPHITAYCSSFHLLMPNSPPPARKRSSPSWSTMLMYWKTMFDRCYCINSTIYLLKFGKLYGTIFCHRLTVSERVHIF